MSSLPSIPATDLAEEEQRSLALFKETGLPGISRVSDSDIHAWFSLYMSGKSYAEISAQFNAPIERVLFMAEKYSWFKKKVEHLGNIHSKIQQRAQNAQIESASFLLDYIAFIHKKLGGNINRFLAGDIDAAMGVTQKDLDKYFKAVDALGRLSASSPTPSAPPNPGGTTIVNNGGTVNVGDPAAGAIDVKARPLRAIAEAKRAEKVRKEDKK